ncbi:MAG: phosphoadenosine phosphosulfate reductase family protein [Cyanobacteria bacterium P01_G01_bin.38]
MQQLSLFESTSTNQTVPSPVQRVLALGATLAVSVSGGKDSDAMLRHLVRLHQAQKWPGKMFAITADLGRIEWPGTLEHIKALCDELGVPLEVVRRAKGGMIDRWDQRRQTLQDSGQHKPFWSSASARYCTKELKTAECDRNLRAEDLVVCAVGIRAKESPNRAKQPRFRIRSAITTAALKEPKGMATADEKERWAEGAISTWLDSGRKGRLALTWHPIFDWSLGQVWRELGTSLSALDHRRALYQAGQFAPALQGWPAHWAYVSGNSRLSCSLCVLASSADILNGAMHNPRTWAELALMEAQSGWSFQQGQWLGSLNIDPRERLEGLRRLFKVLGQLGLLMHPAPKFVIVLLQTCPIEIAAWWQADALAGINQTLHLLTNPNDFDKMVS